MTEETQLEEPWKAALRRTLTDANYIAGTRSVLTTAVLAAVLPHMETSYRTGRMAGASASAARLAQKNLELSKTLREAREYVEHSKDGAGRTRVMVLTILAGES